ncbi:MAG: amidase [Aestuariivirgaceae bacterium]
MNATEAARRIRDGLISSEELVRACLDRIAETDGGIKAWVHLDQDQALDQARAMDRIRQAGLPVGPLQGVPVGIKDIYDTANLPTECGTKIYKDRRPGADAAVIARLREAGAVIMGKTHTTEVAFLHPTITANPHNLEHTPGGSSSGSAAAVAAGHVPLAIGSQTNGSTIRPASFCGIYGFKPTRGIISRTGCLKTSETLDQVGVFARTLEDAALLADVLAGYDRADQASYVDPKPAMLAGARTEPPVEPDIAWLELPFADRLDASSVEGFDELVSALGTHVEKLPAPTAFEAAVKSHNIVHEY